MLNRSAPARSRSLSLLFASVALGACILATSPPHPASAPPRAPEGAPIWRAALQAPGRRIVVSVEARRLWLLSGNDTLFTAPVAVGRGSTFKYRGKTYRFATPRGQRRIIAKETNPVWRPPDWHYYEKAARRRLEAVKLEPGQRVRLSDGTFIEVRGNQVGRINRYGNFWPFTPGMEIIFDGKIFIPPLDSAQRQVPNALGTHKLDLGDGYLIHGTHVYNRDTIGRAVSHGCIRMRNRDIARLYSMVEVGTPVFIY
ncbi:MAG TPA: L,D-transpeptidase [Longimicrobiales bacterium]